MDSQRLCFLYQHLVLPSTRHQCQCTQKETQVERWFLPAIVVNRGKRSSNLEKQSSEVTANCWLQMSVSPRWVLSVESGIAWHIMSSSEGQMRWYQNPNNIQVHLHKANEVNRVGLHSSQWLAAWLCACTLHVLIWDYLQRRATFVWRFVWRARNLRDKMRKIWYPDLFLWRVFLGFSVI